MFGPLANRVLKAFGRQPLPAVISLQGIIALLIFFAAIWSVISIGVYCVARSVSSMGGRSSVSGVSVASRCSPTS